MSQRVLKTAQVYAEQEGFTLLGSAVRCNAVKEVENISHTDEACDGGAPGLREAR